MFWGFPANQLQPLQHFDRLIPNKSVKKPPSSSSRWWRHQGRGLQMLTQAFGRKGSILPLVEETSLPLPWIVNCEVMVPDCGFHPARKSEPPTLSKCRVFASQELPSNLENRAGAFIFRRSMSQLELSCQIFPPSGSCERPCGFAHCRMPVVEQALDWYLLDE